MAFYGLENVIYTELSGRGLYSMLKPTRHRDKSIERSMTMAVNPKWQVIHLDAQIIPHQKQNRFKYFTEQDGIWIERVGQGYDAPEDNTKK